MAANNVKKSVTIFINGKQAEATVGNLRKKSRELNNEINQLVPGTQAYINKTKELKGVNRTLDQHKKSVKGIGGAFGSLKTGLASTAISLFGIQAAIGGVIAVFSSAVGIIRDYDQANSKLQAVLKDTTKTIVEQEEEMEALTEQSKDLGSTTAFTATEVAQLQTELAKLGFPAEEILDMTEAVLDGSAAMGSELAPTAALVGATLKSFGLEASEAGRVADVLAASTSNSALDFEKLNASMSTIAPVASKLGFGLEDTTALLGNLSDAGFDASSAATATRNILLNLADSNGKLAKSLGEPVKDLPGLVAGLKKLQEEGTDLGEALELTDKRSVAAFSTFLSGTNDIEDLQKALINADGSAKDMADTMLDNLAGDTAIANSAWEGFVLSLDDGDGVISKVLRNATQGFTDFISGLTELNKFDFGKIFEPDNVTQFNTSLIDLSATVSDIYAPGLGDVTRAMNNLPVERLTAAFGKFNKQQLNSAEGAKVVVKKFKELGLTTEEAIAKYKELSGFQKKATKDTVDNAEEITDATVVQIETIASLNAELTERKKTLETLEVGSKQFIKVQNEIVSLEKKIASATGKTAKQRTKNADKSLKDLEKLKAGVEKFRTDLENRQAVELLKTDDEKEQAKLQQSLDKKFSKEIKSAEELAKGKGKVAEEAQKQLDALLLIKQKEFEDGKVKLQLESLQKVKKKNQEDNAAALQTVKSLADAEVILQQNKLDQISDQDFRAKEAQEEVLVQALKDRIEAEREIEINQLQERKDNGLISEEEFLAELAIITDEARVKEDALDQARADRQIALRQQVTDASVQFAQFGINAIAQFSRIQADKDIATSEDKAAKEIELLEKQLAKGAISQEQFEAKKQKIEEESQKEQAKIKTKAAQTEKSAALIQATIDTSLAILKATAAAPPPINIPLIALAAAQGAIQIGLIASQPIPQFIEGGGTDRLMSGSTQKVIGADDNKLYNAKINNDRRAGRLKGGPQLMLVNEDRPEYFIPGDLLSNPVVADQVQIIEAIRTGRQFQEGGATQDTGTIDVTATPEAEDTESINSSGITTRIIEQNTAAIDGLNSRIDRGIFVVLTNENIDQITDTQLEIAEIKGQTG